ncbi:MAG TPA: glycosyltransferase [Thiobacillus sp.]
MNAHTSLTVSFCTFKRAHRLEKLVAALRAQACPIPFEILVINNNSPDDTLKVLSALQQQSGAPLRVVTESEPGIVPARNRALNESINQDILVFLDDDELPQPGFLAAAHDAIVNEGAHCVGGRIDIDYTPCTRPGWLDDEVAGFLGMLDHGTTAFWLDDDTRPIWSGNTAYSLPYFRERPNLRFDTRYNRTGDGVGGGEDAMMLRSLLALGAKIRYRPDMAVWHAVDPWKLNRRYFIHLHYQAGIRQAQFGMPDFPTSFLGFPLFMLRQLSKHLLSTLTLFLTGKPGLIRQAMNTSNALGAIVGYRRRTTT